MISSKVLDLAYRTWQRHDLNDELCYRSTLFSLITLGEFHRALCIDATDAIAAYCRFLLTPWPFSDLSNIFRLTEKISHWPILPAHSYYSLTHLSSSRYSLFHLNLIFFGFDWFSIDTKFIWSDYGSIKLCQKYWELFVIQFVTYSLSLLNLNVSALSSGRKNVTNLLKKRFTGYGQQ